MSRRSVATAKATVSSWSNIQGFKPPTKQMNPPPLGTLFTGTHLAVAVRNGPGINSGGRGASKRRPAAKQGVHGSTQGLQRWGSRASSAEQSWAREGARTFLP